MVKTVARVLLGLSMGFAGLQHFLAVDSFRAQVPPWLPFEEAVIAVSGIIELGFAAGLLFAPAAWRARVGWALAAFFVAIFPGNIWQFLEGESAFGLDSDAARFVRLFFQPVFVLWALWSTGAWPREKAAGS